MISNVQGEGSPWVKTPDGKLRHVSGLSFKLNERSGREGAAVLWSIMVDQTTLTDWRAFELASGTPIGHLRGRMEQLERDALAYANQ
ncbi:MAG: hypothetical protein H7203_13195 [Rhizobacter sp.]|nr:hypothetical protein [Burkholderiales bacterium]